MQRMCAAVAIILVGAGIAAAVDIQVDNVRGDDYRDGGTGRLVGATTGPVRTIGRALQLALVGDRIVLAKNAEPYRESVTLQGPRHSGSDLRPFTIDGQGAILDGTVAVSPAVWQFVERDIFRFEPPTRTMGLLMKDGKPAPQPDRADRSAGRALEPGQAVLADGAVWFRVEPSRLPVDYDLRWSGQRVGITTYDVRQVVIRDLVVQGFALDGINVHDRATGVQLEGLILRGNGRSGLHVGGASRVELSASLLGNNGRAQVHLEGACRLRVTGCELLRNPAPPLWQEGGQIFGDALAEDRQARASFVDGSERGH